MWDLQRLRSACAFAQSDQSLCLSLEYSMSVKLLTEQRLFLSLKKSCTGSFKSIHNKNQIFGNLMWQLKFEPAHEIFILATKAQMSLFSSTEPPEPQTHSRDITPLDGCISMYKGCLYEYAIKYQNFMICEDMRNVDPRTVHVDRSAIEEQCEDPDQVVEMYKVMILN